MFATQGCYRLLNLRVTVFCAGQLRNNLLSSDCMGMCLACCSLTDSKLVFAFSGVQLSLRILRFSVRNLAAFCAQV